MRLATSCILAALISALAAASLYGGERAVWKPVQFAILRFNDDAPASWNMYHGEKHGVLLVRLWKRYMLVDVKEQEVYEVDPEKVKPQGQNVEWRLPMFPISPSKRPSGKFATSAQSNACASGSERTAASSKFNYRCCATAPLRIDPFLNQPQRRYTP